MIAISTACIMSAFLSFESALTVFRLNRRSPVNLSYVVFTLNFALLCMAFSQFIVAPDKPTALFWQNVMILPLVALPPLVLHFTLFMTAGRRIGIAPLTWLLLYIPPAITALQGFRGVLVTDIYQTPWGWENLHAVGSFWSTFSVVQCLLYIFASVLLMARQRFFAPSAKKKKQAGPILISLAIGASGWFASLLCIYSVDPFLYTVVSNLSFIMLITPFIMGVRLSINRHGLMRPEPQRPAAQLLGGIKDPIFLVTMKGAVLYMNDGARALTSRGGVSTPRFLSDIFGHSEEIAGELEAMNRETEWGRRVSCAITGRNGERIACTLTFKGIRNDAGEIAGALVIASEDPSVDAFRSRYGITGREMEILLCSVSGLTNPEIAARLGISIRTVEHHHLHIYNKLGINNRIELYTMALRYRLLSN